MLNMYYVVDYEYVLMNMFCVINDEYVLRG